jgi:hypothetical protein
MKLNVHKLFTPEYYWFGVFALCFISFQSISYSLRPNYQGENELVVYFFGIAPNFFTAVGIPALFVLFTFTLTKSNTIPKWLKEYKHLIANAISLTGLISWEFLQITGKLVFDWNDIVWSIVGAFCFQILWSLSPLKFKISN